MEDLAAGQEVDRLDQCIRDLQLEVALSKDHDELLSGGEEVDQLDQCIRDLQLLVALSKDHDELPSEIAELQTSVDEIGETMERINRDERKAETRRSLVRSFRRMKEVRVSRRSSLHETREVMEAMRPSSSEQLANASKTQILSPEFGMGPEDLDESVFRALFGITAGANWDLELAWNFLRRCAGDGRGGKTLTKLLEVGGKVLSKEEIAKWLLQVDRDGWSVLHICTQYQEKEETLIEVLEYGGKYLPEDEMAKWLSQVSNDGSSVLHVCARNQKEGEMLIELLEYGGKYLPKEEIGKWLSHVNDDGWSVLGLCARYQEKGKTLIKLLEYGEKYLPEEEMTKWLLQVNNDGESVIHLCGQYQEKGEAFIKLLEYGGNCLPKEETGEWLHTSRTTIAASFIYVRNIRRREKR